MPWPLIRAAARESRVSPLLVGALILRVSGGAFWRSELRPTFPAGRIILPELHARRLGTSVRMEVLAQMHTYGHLQLVGAVARWLGFEGHLAQLSLPESGLTWGCRYLAWLLGKLEREEAIAAFGVAGEPLVRSAADPERLVNQAFVTDVLRSLQELKGLEKEGRL